jgi:hypothetical protein
LRPASAGRAAFQSDHDVKAIQTPAAATEHLSYHALDAIPVNSSRRRFPAGDDADTSMLQAIRPGKHHEVAARASRALRQRRCELFRAP